MTSENSKRYFIELFLNQKLIFCLDLFDLIKLEISSRLKGLK